MANPTVLRYQQNPPAGPITIDAPGLGNTTVLLQHMIDPATNKDAYYTVAYVAGSKPTSTSVTLSDTTTWWIQVSLPGGVGTALALIEGIFPIKATAKASGVHPDDGGDPPPPGPVHGGDKI